MAHARPTTDEFDMAKLQKSLKQRQRNSIRNKNHVAKLTPAEIRSLNNSAVASITSSHTSSKGTSPSTSRRGTTTTPPASPDDANPLDRRTDSISRNSVSRKSITNVPTPPLTPNDRRHSSSSSIRSHHQSHGHGHAHTHGQGKGHMHHHGHANGIIYAPRPRGHVQPTFMASNGISSRPSSSGSSTYRGLPTYRGPEVTRTGSMNMLQRPSPTIVANPLSNFSRPRQSMFSSSPERCRHDSQDMPYERTHSFQNSRANSLPNVSAPSSRPASPPRVSDSPVSMLADDTERFPAFDPDDPHNQPKDLSEDEEIQARDMTQQFNTDQSSNQPVERPASPVSKPREVEQAESPKKDKGKKFTIGTAFFGGDKSSLGENTDKAAAKLKKTRRRTLSFTKGGEVEQTPSNPDEGHAVDGGALENDDYSTHPAIRPLSLEIPSEDKGKGKEIQSAPVYARCACCGKIKKPSAFTNELSPVLENENLRTNFSFEIDRTSDSTGRRSSDASRGKFIPIIPMAVSATETRQASIEPYTNPTMSSPVKNSPKNNNQKSSLTTSPRNRQKYLDPPKFVRFASLHGRRNTDPTIIAEEDEYSDSQQSRPLMNGFMEGAESYRDEDNGGGVDYSHAFSRQALFIASTQPVIDGPVTHRTAAEDKSKNNHNNLAIAPHRSSHDTSSETEVFFTPNRGTSPAVVDATAAAQTQQPQPQPQLPAQKQRLAQEDSFSALPETNLAIDFKDFVIPPPTPTPGSDALLTGAGKEQQKCAPQAQVVAV